MGGRDSHGLQRDVDALSGTVAYHELISVIISFFLESVLFGAFAVTYVQGTWRLLRVGNARYKTSRREWAVSLASTAMLVLALGHLVLNLQSMLYGARSLSSAYAELEDKRGLLPKLGVYITQTLIADAFMMYRVFIVWDRRRRVLIAPAILTVIGVATGYGSLIEGSVLNFNGFPIPFCIATICTNVLCTALVMWRILRSPHDSTVPIPITRRFALARRVAEAIVQSAAIYTVASAALLITYSARQDDGYLACLNVFPSLIGLVFSLIVLRLAKRRPATQNLESTWWHARISRRPSAGDGNTPRLPIPGCSGPPLTPPLHIHLSRLSFSSDTLPVAVNEPRSVASLDKPLVLDRLQ